MVKDLTKEQAEKDVSRVLDKYEDDWNNVEIALTEDCNLQNPRIKALADELKDHFDAQKYREIRKVMTRVKPEDE